MQSSFSPVSLFRQLYTDNRVEQDVSIYLCIHSPARLALVITPTAYVVILVPSCVEPLPCVLHLTTLVSHHLLCWVNAATYLIYLLEEFMCLTPHCTSLQLNASLCVEMEAVEK